MNDKKIKACLALLALLAVLPVLVINSRARNSAAEIIKEIKPVYGSIQSFISTTGIVQPQNRLEIKPPIAGRIEEVIVKEGDKVKTGQVMARMSSTERAALLDAAHSQGEEAINYWKDVYKATPLIAPLDGEVIVRAVEPGQTVTSNDALIVLSDRLIVEAQVDETDIGRVKVGQLADIGLDAYPEVKVKGAVDHISYESEIINNVTIYKVDILPEKVPEVFRSGMSANINIVEKGRENALLIPLNAVIEEKNDKFVMIKKHRGASPEKVKVVLGISDDSNVEVLSGVNPGDRIIIKKQKYDLSKKDSKNNPFMPFGSRTRR